MIHAPGYGNGGGRGIRTPEPLSGLTVFKTAGFNHSPIPPHKIRQFLRARAISYETTTIPNSPAASSQPSIRSQACAGWLRGSAPHDV